MTTPKNHSIDLVRIFTLIILVSVCFSLYSIGKIAKQTNRAAFFTLKEISYYRYAPSYDYSKAHYNFITNLLEEFYAEYGDPYWVTKEEITRRYDITDKETIDRILGNASEQQQLQSADRSGRKYKPFSYPTNLVLFKAK